MDTSSTNQVALTRTGKTVAVLTDDYVDFQRTLIDTISSIVAKDGYHTVTFAGRELEVPDQLHQSMAVGNEIYRLAERADLAGIICVSGGVGRHVDQTTLARFINRFDVPVVSLGMQIDSVPSVIAECKSAMHDLMKHVLHDEKRTRFAFLRGFPEDRYSLEREMIFREHVLAAGHEIDEELFITGNYDSFDAYNATLELLETHPDVDTIVAANDAMALSAARVAASLGMRIPQDIAITGFDDSSEATEHSPALTTVRQHITGMAEVAAQRLLEQLDSESHRFDSSLLTEVPSELVIRGSTAAYHEAVHPDTRNGIANRLTQSLSGLEHPPGVMISSIASALELSLTSGYFHLAKCLDKLHKQCNDPDHAHWLRALCYQIELLATEELTRLGRPEEVITFIGTLAGIREKVWTRSLSRSFEEQRMHESRSSLQVQIGSCTRRDDMLRVLDRWLADVRPRRFYLAHYDIPSSSIPQRARLLRVAHSGQPQSRPATFFDTADLLPISALDEPASEQLVLFPIFAGDLHFGYMLVDPTGFENMHLDDTATSIGNALRNQHMIQTLERQAMTLQAANDILNKQVNHDTLTNLPNRRQLEAQLTAACEHAATGSQPFSLCFLDLDGFKNVNDTLGHDIGDLLLRQVAQRLRETTYQLVADRGIVARLGGDEFVLLVHEADEHEMDRLCAAILESLLPQFELEGHAVSMSASLGYTCAPMDGISASELLRAADAAMYDAKAHGKNRYQRFRRERVAEDRAPSTSQIRLSPGVPCKKAA